MTDRLDPISQLPSGFVEDAPMSAPPPPDGFELDTGPAPSLTPAPKSVSSSKADLGAVDPGALKDVEAGWYSLRQGLEATKLVGAQKQLDENTPGAPGPAGPRLTGRQTIASADVHAAAQRTRDIALHGLAEFTAKGNAIPAPDSANKFNNANTWGEAWDAFVADPYTVTRSTVLRSGPASMPSIVGGIIGSVLGPAGAAVGAGGGSYVTELGNAIATQLQRRGANLEDPKSVLKAWREFGPDIMQHSQVRAAIVGAFDAASGGLTGKLVEKPVEGVLKELGRDALGTGIQMAGGAGGELGAEVATGEPIQPGNIAGEMLGEAGQGAVEVGGQSVVAALKHAVGAKTNQQENGGGPPPPDGFTVDEPQVSRGTKGDQTPPVGTAPMAPRLKESTPIEQPAPPIPSKSDEIPQNLTESAAAPPEGFAIDGSRANPQIAESGSIDSARANVAQPTEAQAAAGNYRMGHVKVQGLDVTLETPKGGERSGKGPDGKPWSVTMQDDYGYVKRSVGADNEQVDVFIGPDHSSEKAFVIDQFDPHTKAWDEHKAVLGAQSEAEARAIYERGFSDGKAPQRIGGITAMSVPEFKDWLAKPQTKPVAQAAALQSGSETTQKPLKSETPAVTSAQEKAVKAYIGGTDRLTPEAMAAATKTEVPEASRLLSHALGKGWIRQTRTGKLMRQAKSDKPVSLMQFLAENGGIQDQGGELKARDLHTKMIPGQGRLVRKDGMTLDHARELAVEAGYLEDAGRQSGGQSQSTIQDLLDALDRENSGQKVVTQQDQTHAQAMEAETKAKAGEAQLADRYSPTDKAFIEKHGFSAFEALDLTLYRHGMAWTDWKPADLDKIAALINDNMSAENALERVALESERPEDVNLANQEDAGIVPFDEVYTRPAPESGGRVHPSRPEEPGPSPEKAAGGERTSPADAGQTGQPTGEPGQAAPVTSEKTAAGEQTVVPGAEQISQAEQAQRKSDEKLKAKTEQKPMESGLFGDERNQTDIFDKPKLDSLPRVQQRKPEAQQAAVKPLAESLKIAASSFGYKIVDTGLPFGAKDHFGHFYSFGTQLLDRLIPGDKLHLSLDRLTAATPAVREYIKAHMTAPWFHRVWFGHDPLANIGMIIDKFGVSALPDWWFGLLKDSMSKAGIPLPGVQWLVQAGLVGDKAATNWLSLNIGEALSGGLSILGTYRLYNKSVNGKPIHYGWAIAGVLFKTIGGVLSSNPVVLISAAADAVILAEAKVHSIKAALRKAGAIKAAAPKQSVRPKGTLESVARTPVATITGTELGVAFKGPEDMPALRQAAERWYEDNLRGTVAHRPDGTPVQFSRKSRNKSTSGKTDLILRAVPAIRDIIEKGEEVARTPGDRDGVKESVWVGAPVEIMGKTHNLVVALHVRNDGTWHYDLGYRGEDKGSPGVGVPGGPARLSMSRQPAKVESAPDINLFEPGPDFKTPETTVPNAYDKVPPYSFVISDKQRAAITGRVQTLAHNILGHRLPINVELVDTLGAERQGMYNPNTFTISVAIRTSFDAAEVLGHEAIHALRDVGVFTDQEWQILSDWARDKYLPQTNIRDLYTERYRKQFDISEAQLEELIIEEGVADAFGRHVSGTLKAGTPSRVSAILTKLQKFFDSVRNMLSGYGFKSASDIFANVASGGMRDRPMAMSDRGFELYLRQGALESVVPQAANTDSPAFKKWFGDSRAVDEGGKPLIVYHGSNQRFSAFEQRGSFRQGDHGPEEVTSPVFFFSPNKDTARLFAKDKVQIAKRLKGETGGRAEVRPFYLAVKNPLDFTGGRFGDNVPNPEAVQVMHDLTGYTPETWQDVQRNLDDPLVVDRLHQDGFDGVVLREDDGGEAWGVFDPAQIKSVFNRGNFDPTKQGILENVQRPGMPSGDPYDVTPDPAAKEELANIASNINLDYIAAPDDIKKVISDVSEQSAHFIGARRGKISNQQTRELAADLGMSVADLTKRQHGQAFNAENIFAARVLLVKSATRLRALAAKARQTEKMADLAEFQKAFTRHVAIQEQVAGLAAEAGRALQQFKIMAGDNFYKGAKDLIETARSKNPDDPFGKRNKFGRDAVLNLADMVDALGDPSQINRFSRDAFKVTIGSMIREAWINALLSGPRTHVTNILSNALTALWQVPETAIAATIGALHGGEKVQFAETSARLVGLIEGAQEGLRAGATAFKTGEPSDLGSKLESHRYAAIPGIAGQIIRIPSRGLLAEDEVFKAVNYRAELNAQATRIALSEGRRGRSLAERIDELRSYPTQAMKTEAHKAALYNTFQNELGPIGKAIMRMRDTIPGAWIVLPFIKTPANIVKYAAERSPFGLLMKEVRANLDGKNGNVARDTQAARLFLGSSIGITVAMMAAGGLISGGGPDDPDEKKLLQAKGWQAYSLKIGDTWYSYQRLDPFGFMMGVSADLIELGEAVGNADASKVGSMIVSSITNNLLDKTWLRGLGDLVQAVQDPGRYGEYYVRNLVGTLVPTGVAQVAQTNDPVLRDARSIVDVLKSRIPGMSQTLLPKRNIFGEEIKRGGALGPDLISPIFTSTEKKDKVIDEMVDLHFAPSMPQREINKHKLDEILYDEYSELAGKAAKKELDRKVNQPSWDDKSPDLKTKIIKKAFEDVRDEARDKMKRLHPELRKKPSR